VYHPVAFEAYLSCSYSFSLPRPTLSRSTCFTCKDPVIALI
jgi:hypothetical protein